jgi:hypothetical protein
MTISRTLQDPYGGVEKLHHKHRPDDRVFVEHNGVFHRGKIESGDGTHYHVKLDSGHEIVAHELELTPEDWPADEKPAAEHAEVVCVQKATAEGKSIAAGNGVHCGSGYPAIVKIEEHTDGNGVVDRLSTVCC